MNRFRRLLVRPSRADPRRKSPRLGLVRAVVLFAWVASMPLSAFAQLVDITDSPLYGGRSPHPNVAVAPSVEFPTVGAAFRNVPIYVPTTEYLGYFDPSRCYSYTKGAPGLGFFSPSSKANSKHECKGLFSGNFMNWVTMSSIDEFRYAMTGGNRVVDPSGRSGAVVERAYLPDGSVPGVESFYNLAFNFPRHTLHNGKIDGTPASRLTAVLPSSIGKDTDLIYVSNCKTQVFFNKSGGGTCLKPDGSQGTFDIRVQVCDAKEGPARPDLCKNYGTASAPIYKPIGETQRNASKMRFSVFGYLMDQSPPSGCDDGTGWNRCRYGGVMRAPMKYLGATQYDANLVPSANSNSEINSDGTLVVDPDRAKISGGTYSGVINYLNKFGSTGHYKRHDPFGELYYEALRYFQGPAVWTGSSGPTPEAISGMTLPMQDGFPVVKAWSDPILSTCSANYIVTVGDTNNSNDVYLPGFIGKPSADFRPKSRPTAGGLDVTLWTRRIGDLESAGFASLTSNDSRSDLANLENLGTGNNNTASYLAAGAAFWANTQDVRPDLTGKQTVKTIAFDAAEPGLAGTLNTVIQRREIYLMGKYGGFNNTIDRASDTYPNPFFATDPSAPGGPAIRSNSEWDDGSGSPANYLLASDPRKLINGLRAAFARISASTGTLSGASLTSANLTYGAAGAYIATFDPIKWSGSVLFNSLSVDPMTGLLVVSRSPIWDSGSLLTARCGTVLSGSTVCTDTDTSVNKRNIVTTIDLGGTRVAKDFTYANIALDPAYLLTLNTDPATGLPDAPLPLGQQRVNYLRGYRGDETGAIRFRARDSAMGDIINSGPVYVGPPTTAIPDADYQPFYAANNARAPAVYVGANDGMLHAIRAATGVELFAYIPGFSARNLNDLTNPGYAHETFVDTVPKVQEAKVGGVWKTVLVGANGNGAQGVFALDVTDPTAFGPGKVLFEFSDADDPDFGNVLASPEIAKLRVGPATGSGAAVYKYFAVVTGYNNKRTDVNGHVGGDTQVSSDTLNRGVLFLLSLDHPLGTPWVLGTDYYKFRFPATAVGSPNGLGPVTLLPSRSGDRSTAAMYFGDLQGNLWRFNTVGNDPSAWTPARGTVAAPLPIFVATDSGGKPQPITARPELAAGPFGSTLVFFGTGKYLGASDLSLPGAQQSEYGLLDTQSSAVITRASDLVARTTLVTTDPVTGKPVVTVAGAPFRYSGTAAKKGWVLDFPSSVSIGERSVTKPAVRTGLLTFTTLTLSADICGGGSGYIYQVNALTGLPYGAATFGGYASTVGIPGPPRIVDLTLTPGLTRATGEQINKKTQATLVSGSLGKIDTPGALIPSKTPPVGRINWREITNWNDLTGN